MCCFLIVFKIFYDILCLRGTDQQNNVVLANSALAISTVKEIDMTEAFEIARQSLYEKRALDSFKKLIELSKWIF